ncbi:thioesterase II family protein [Peribacillus simplex]|uniref:thioesterase II family protein n=1 Tax=Peribacillus simplex TaxID=1478 RepID=UPI003D288F55
MSNTDSSWFVCRYPRAFPKIKLFCFPYAGGGSSVYREWDLNHEDIELHAALLPGRENRFTEPPISSMEDLIQKLSVAMLEHLDTPFAFFGHSMGALIAYELAGKLKSLYGVSPVHLFVSGKSAPQLKQKQPPINNLPRDIFLERILSFGGTPKEIIYNQEVLELYEQLLRGDFKLCETYIFNNRELLNCPITILGGYQDNTISLGSLEKWNELTTSPSSLKMYAGDHFFIRTQRLKIQQLIYNSLISEKVANKGIL